MNIVKTFTVVAQLDHLPVSSVSESAMTTHWGTLLKLFNHTTILANALNECEEGRREKIEQLRLAGLAG
ncbi:hypothetical protein BDR07DRAFT_638981 [Suillus spraguei]|nr:hypothetical protein BDR07DRAFT_638981 [Suillus spraguei]